jgi:diacylglycerol kinase family enzyme
MYFYIYDSFLADRKHERALAAVETRLTDLGISGKIGRLTPFTNARGLIRDESRRGVQTVVIVGNDETVAKVVEGIGEEKITLGIIPVGTPTFIARSLGIPEGEEACEVLSKRITQKIDLGRINGRYFLSEVRIPRGRVTIEASQAGGGGTGTYRISSIAAECEIIVSNLRRSDIGDQDQAGRMPGDPKDGWLDAVITAKSQGFLAGLRRSAASPSTVIPLRRLSITADEPFAVVADGRAFTNNNVSIEVVPEKLKIITGRERAFA